MTPKVPHQVSKMGRPKGSKEPILTPGHFQRKFMTTREAAQYAGLYSKHSFRTIEAWIKKGHLEDVVWNNNGYMVTTDAIDDYLRERMRQRKRRYW